MVVAKSQSREQNMFKQKGQKKIVKKTKLHKSKNAVKRKAPDSDLDTSDEEDPSTILSKVAENTVTSEQHGKQSDKALGTKPQAKKAKISKADLHKAPTAEELAKFKESEHMFQSSLFQLQVTELLAEITLKKKKRGVIDSYITKLSQVLLNLSPGNKYELSDLKWLKKHKVKMPMIMSPQSSKGKFQFYPPISVRTVGSYPLGLAIKPDPAIDVALMMPKECFQAKDHLNQRYLRKRALYLAVIGSHLRSCGLVQDVSFTYHHGNNMRPILVVKPEDDHGKGFVIHIHLYPEEGTFKLNRFHIDKNNIRTKWFTQQESNEAEDASDNDPEPATPHYNTWVLQDLVQEPNQNYIKTMLEDSPNVREGVALLKVWLHQRKLDQGLGCLSGYIMTTLVAYLLSTRKLTTMMSSYQIMRNTLLHLSRSNWAAEGISLSRDKESSINAPTMDDFQKTFDVVFVDKTGFVNICCDVYKTTFDRVVHEAHLSLQILENPVADGFTCLFMNPVKFLMTFDQCFHIHGFSSCVDKLCSCPAMMDRCSNTRLICVPQISEIIRKALGERLQMVSVQLQPCKKWPIASNAPNDCQAESLTFGLLLNRDSAYSILEKGPPAELPQAAEFRDFWGEKSELRRFQDGSICEAVVWSSKTWTERRRIIGKIIKYIINRHTDIPKADISFVSSQLDPLLMLPHCEKRQTLAYGTGEEQVLHIHRCYDELAKTLRSLKDLPLAIHTIQGISAVFRYSEVFPPMVGTNTEAVRSEDLEIYRPDPTWRCPPWTPVIKVLCILEASGKWPEDKDAIKRVKAAFLIKIGQLLRQHHGLNCQITPTFLDVLKAGFVFRLEIGYMKEITMLKVVTTPEGMVRMVETPEAIALQKKLVALPQLTSSLHGLHQQNNSWSGCVRLAKRWISAHLLLDGYISEETVELLVAHLYITPAPYVQSNSPLTCFLRFLALLSTHDWQRTSLVVNLNNQLTREEVSEVQTYFTRERPGLPSMFIATPQDRKSSQWTRQGPSPQILQRLVLLARESLAVLEQHLQQGAAGTDLKQVFRPPLDLYDVVIHLDPKQLARRHHAVDVTTDTYLPQYMDVEDSTDDGGYLPVIEYNPVQNYLQELRESFEDVALFFHDVYGGDIVAVLWKPAAFQPRPFKTSHLHGRVVVKSQDKKDTKIVSNVETILEVFKVLGKGLVTKLETKMENWKI